MSLIIASLIGYIATAITIYALIAQPHWGIYLGYGWAVMFVIKLMLDGLINDTRKHHGT